MKKYLLLVFLASSVQAQAWVSTPTAQKEHKFVYRVTNGAAVTGSFEYASTAPSYEEAYEKAAKACYQHFRDEVKKQTGGRKLSEDQGLDIIDLCANPRSL